jgi:phenylacetate-CoA ligase
MDIYEIYNRLPLFMQNWLATLRGYQIKRERNGEFYQEKMAFLKQFDYSDEAALRSYQDQELRRLIKYAAENSSFYNELYQDIDLDEIKGVEDLAKLPILEKDMVRPNLDRMYTIDEREAFVSYTSGTTGSAMKYLHTFEGLQVRNAFLDDFKRQHGFINGKMKKASFAFGIAFDTKREQKVFWRDNRALKQRIYSTLHLHEENLQQYVDSLNEFQPDAIDGYPSSIYEVARFINKYQLSLTFQPLAVFSTSETLLPHYRKEIEEAFNCQVFDQYASSEASPFVTECTAGHLHQNMLSGVIEQDENNDMLITTFMNDGTPLIRYRIGDRIKYHEGGERCACGSALPLVEELQGRSSAYIESSARGRYTEVFFSLLADNFDNSLAAFQFIQPKMDHIIVKVVTDEGYTDEMDQDIIDQITYVLGEDITVEIRKVPEIKRDKSGKLKFIINEMA